jgi:hypothetical protein
MQSHFAQFAQESAELHRNHRQLEFVTGTTFLHHDEPGAARGEWNPAVDSSPYLMEPRVTGRDNRDHPVLNPSRELLRCSSNRSVHSWLISHSEDRRG